MKKPAAIPLASTCSAARLACLAMVFSSLAISAQAQLEVQDGQFEFDMVSMMGAESPHGELASFGSFWLGSHPGDFVTGILNPSTTPASPLGGQVGQFRGDSFIYQHIGFLEGDTAYSITFDFQTVNGAPFYALLAFADEYGSPETGTSMGGGWYIVPIGGSNITSASFQNEAVSSTPSTMDEVYGSFFYPTHLGSPYVGSGRLDFTTSSEPDGRAVFLVFGAAGAVVPRTQVDNVALESQAVPEPTTGLLAALGAGALFLNRRGARLKADHPRSN